MWLLSTDRAELHQFPSPEDIDSGYAILSHTWRRSPEQTFQDIQELGSRCKADGLNPRDSNFISDKIRQSCIIAERHGYKYIWIDTCCIDKENSAELSESVNSMFRWYAAAEVCYAYLEDVPDDCDVNARDSAFRTARWHTRGWTLQELIAPCNVLFYSHGWNLIGSKIQLAELLFEITRVWSGILKHESKYSTASVAQRMGWASRRHTTRIEDEAYCLMGLFDVNLPTIYGEGRQAFQRLQQEIMRKSNDTSLFAWGAAHLSPTLAGADVDLTRQLARKSSMDDAYLLAPSPQSFSEQFNGRVVRYTPNTSTVSMLQPYLAWQWRDNPQNGGQPAPKDLPRPFGPLDLPTFTLTNFGVSARLPIVRMGKFAIAVLLCDNKFAHIGLLLHASNTYLQHESRAKYGVGIAFTLAGGPPTFARLINLGTDLSNIQIGRDRPKFAWADVVIADRPHVASTGVLSACYRLNSLLPDPPFLVPQWLVGRLARLDLQALKPQIHGDPTTAFHVILRFENAQRWEGVRIVLGTCDRIPSRGARVHWANATPLTRANWNLGAGSAHDYGGGAPAPIDHKCPADHIGDWGACAREFGDRERRVRLSFAWCARAPQGATLVLGVELAGSVYAPMLEAANLRFPHPQGLPPPSTERADSAGMYAAPSTVDAGPSVSLDAETRGGSGLVVPYSESDEVLDPFSDVAACLRNSHTYDLSDVV